MLPRWIRRTLPTLLATLVAVPLAAQSKAPAKSTAPAADAFWLFSDEPLFPGLKNQELIDGWKYTAGAEARIRFMDESNRLRPLGETERDTYLLYRTTPFVELKHDLATLYIQGIDAESFGEELPPVPIDVNRMDLLQYYLDLNLVDFENDGQLRLKLGRQFLIYGSQHLVSNLGWANTFRNFEGAKLGYTDKDWSIDGFLTQPVNGATVPSQWKPYSHDFGDGSQWFSGVYATYKSLPNATLDMYWLWLSERNDLATRLDGNRHTLGARMAGNEPLLTEGDKNLLTFDWEAEGGYQFGRDDVGLLPDQAVRAGFISTSTGLTAAALPWKPSLAYIYFWGSGDSDPTDGVNNTFSTLYPLGHAYWGQIDNFSGSNLRDHAVQVTVKPVDKLSLQMQYHFFDKAEAADAIYNVAGARLGNLTTSDTNLGQELDLVGTLQLNKNLQLQAGYFWFWYGQAVSGNAGLPPRDDAQQFYFQTTWAF